MKGRVSGHTCGPISYRTAGISLIWDGEQNLRSTSLPWTRANLDAVLPDGKRFVVCLPIDPLPPRAITVVLNWAAGLKRQ